MLPNKRVLTELIGSVYDAAGDATLWEGALGKLARIVRAESAAMVLVELHTVAASWNLDPEASRLYQQYYGALDVWVPRARSKPAEYVCTSESLISPRELASTEFYNDLLIHYGIEHGMFGLVETAPAPYWGSVSFFRGPSSGEFEIGDMETLKFLIPHIRRAFMLHFRFSELRARADGVEAALNLLATAVILVSAGGNVLSMNRRGEELVRRGDGLLVSNRKLSASLAAETVLLRALITGAAKTGNRAGLSAGSAMLLSRRSGSSLSVTVAPLRKGSLGFNHQPCAALFVNDPDQNLEPPTDLLRRCYGLTMAEARLAMIVVEGHSLKEVADICGVTYNTAKSQLKSVFLKTQARRQSELVKLLLGPSQIRMANTSQITP